MISFDMNKSKSLAMPILVEGIDQSQLDFKFIVEINGVSYGFPAIQEEGNIKFNIPALGDVVKHLVVGIYEARLEASSMTQGDSGYYMQPWTEKINVKQSVAVAVQEDKLEEEEEKVAPRKVNLKIASIFSETDGEVVEEECGKDHDKEKKMNKKMRDKFK